MNIKARIRKTGEIVDVIAYSPYVKRICSADYVSYIDSKGIEHDTERGLNFYWDFEPIENIINIDWEQRRYEIAKAAMQDLLNATSVERFTLRIKPSAIAEAAIEYADVLIEELKKK